MAGRQIVVEGEADAEPGQQHGTAFAELDGAFEPDGVEQQDDAGVGEEDETFEAGGDILEAPEIEEAGEVVAVEAKPKQDDFVAAGEGIAAAVPGHEEEGGSGE